MPTPYNPYELPDMAATGGKLPVIAVDTRDRVDPLVFHRCPWAWRTMPSGDYSAVGLERVLAFERKKIGDFIACCYAERERFVAELERLRGYDYAAVMIQGTRGEIERGEFRSRGTPQSILASMDAFEMAFRVPFYFFATADEMAQRIEVLTCRFVRGQAKRWAGIEMREPEAAK